ncbi:MAG TPA: glycosyltransferase family 39 protein [Leptolyngbyaceae cyanobacterium M65_K2018_010]|nr:glycosyltransferase family 39 protein [Leptolyngbyaceae cyanobacterium M65_K2018_010]
MAFLALRLLFWLVTFPNPDEAYYWLWGQHPDFSYYDHPPFQAWVQGAIAAVLGPSPLALRLPNLVSSGILAVVAYRICRYLYGEDGGDRFWLVLLLVASSPLFFLFLALAWHDHWLITFSVLSSFWFVQFVDGYRATGQGDFRYLGGAAVGLGLAGLCKYNALFVGLGFLAILLGDRTLRRLFREPRFYLALGILALVLSPIWLWNLQHDFFSFRFYGDRTRGSGDFSIHPLGAVGYLALCALILGPIQSWSLWRWLRGRPRMAPSLARPSVYPALALWIFGLSTAAFTVLATVSTALYYWNILAYPLLFPLLADQFYQPRSGAAPAAASPDRRRPPLKHPRPLAIAQGLGLLAVGGLMVHYTVIPITAFWGQADGDSAALYGWPAVAAAVTQQAKPLHQPLLLTTDYRSAAALAYQLDNPNILALSGRLDQFDFWYDAPSLQGRDGVLLGESWHPICPAHLALFEQTDPPVTLEVRRFGRVLQTYQIVTGYGFNAGPEGYPLQPDYPLAFSRDGERCLPE